MNFETHIAKIAKVRQNIIDNSEKFAGLQQNRLPIDPSHLGDGSLGCQLAAASNQILAQAADDFFKMNQPSNRTERSPIRLIEATPLGETDSA